MAQQGANIEQLDRLAYRLEHSAEVLTRLIPKLGTRVEQTWWEGNDANRFRSRWHTEHATELRVASNQLASTAAGIRDHAAAQRRASGF